MTLGRTFVLVAMLALVPLDRAGAQFGGMPGMPGGPGFAAPPAAPPPACQRLLKLRENVQRHGEAIQAAEKRKATAAQACKLFKAYIAAEARMMKAINDNGAQCGVPAEVNTQLKQAHARAIQVGNQVCEAAAQAARPAGPTLSEALGTPLTIPDAQSSNRGRGTFDTLTGNVLAR